jgi:hypothetical protein
MKLFRVFSRKNLSDWGKPIAIKQVIPEWYRLSESTYVNPSDPTLEEHAGLKKCMPFMDTLVTGYTLTIPVDLYVTKDEEGNPRFSWNGPADLGSFVDERFKGLGALMPRPAGHHPNHLVFSGFWGWKTPKGWSSLVVHPLNRYDLPFTISAGIVDSDDFNAPGNIPFFLREDFEGTIPAGTPFAQIIPIKRASWLLVDDTTGLSDIETIQGMLVRKPETLYKKIFWRRKEYR